MTAQQLRRLEPSRRHLLMLVLPQALVIERGDELLGLFDKLRRLSDGRARRRVDDQRRKTARQRVHRWIASAGWRRRATGWTATAGSCARSSRPGSAT